MPRFGNRSKANLESCHEDLKLIASEAIKEVDFTIIQGHRGKAEQDRYYNSGTSKVKFPNSKHNKNPSHAFDFIPYPFGGWDDIKGFRRVGYTLLRVAIELKKQGKITHDAEYGGDWKKFRDFPHFALK